MGKPEQRSLTLVAGLQANYASATARLLERIRTVDLEHAPKRQSLMDELGIKSESHLSEALRSKGKNFPLSWLPAYVRYDDEFLISSEIAAWKGCRVVPRRPQSAAERLARLERALERHGDFGDFIRRQADALPTPEDE